jgi:hypothetical protein
MGPIFLLGFFFEIFANLLININLLIHWQKFLNQLFFTSYKHKKGSVDSHGFFLKLIHMVLRTHE